MNLELKFFGSGRRMAAELARFLRDQDVGDECLVTSLNYDALELVRRANPRLRVGMTVAQSIGDIGRLDVEVLNVRADFLTDTLLHEAQRRGKEVHVWLVNDAPSIIRQIKRGVDNILTSDPDLAVRVRDEWDGMSRTERLLLTSRVLLGLEP
jgi:glycerophosphoryl diester phosphodiesterase